MPDYTLLQSSDDSDAPENISSVVSFAAADEHVDFGLDVTNVSWQNGTFDLTEGKVFAVLDTALAEWTDDSGTSHSLTVHNAVITAHYDARTGIAFDTAASVNYVFADVNYTTADSPLIAVNATGEPPGDDAVEIARLDTGAQTVEPRNQHPSGEYGSLTAHTEIVDPAGVSHTGEIADAADVPTPSEINQAVNQNATHGSDAPHNYLPKGHTNPTYDSGETGVVDTAETAESVAGEDVSGAVAEADHAAEADTADTVGNVPPSDFLRTDTTDRMRADVNFDGHSPRNVGNMTVASASGAVLDLRPNTDGTHIVVQHDDPDSGDEFIWQSRPGAGDPLRVAQTTPQDRDLLLVGTDGHVRAPDGDVFSHEGRLASQQWVNQNTVSSGGDSMGGPLDMDGNAVVGVSGVQAEGGQVDVYDRTNIHAPLEENGARVATRQWAYSNVSLGGHTHDGRYYREAETYSTGQADGRFAGSGHDHDGRYARAGDVYTTGETYSQTQADGRFVNEGETIDMAGNDVRDAFNVWSNNFVFNQQHGNSGPSNLYVDGGGSLLFSPPSTNDAFRIYDNR